MKETVIESMRSALTAYNEPDYLIPLLETNDLFGYDFLWYVYYYELH